MRIPAALHPANHFHVQCLLFHAGFCADSGLASQRGRREMYQLARSLAFTQVALEDGRLEEQRQASTQPQQPPSSHRQQLPQKDLHKCKSPAKPISTVQWRKIAQLLNGVSVHLPPLPQQISSSANSAALLKNLVSPPLLNPMLDSASSSSSAGQPLSAVEFTMAFTAPSRLMPLYAPRTLLPPIPDYPHHDDISYDAAVHHASLLQRLLQPYGFDVELTGGVRRGCPVNPYASFLLSLTADATSEVEAVHEMRTTDTTSLPQQGEGSEDGHATADDTEKHRNANGVEEGSDDGRKIATSLLGHKMHGSRRNNKDDRMSNRSATCSRKVTGYLRRDALMLPMTTTLSAGVSTYIHKREKQWKECVRKDGSSVEGNDFYRQSGRENRGKRLCSRANAFAASDAVSPQVAYRTRRAIQSLIQQGYIVAGHVPFLSSAFLSRRQPLRVSVRYDTRRPTHVPPCTCADPSVLSRLQLHRVHLHFCPWQARPTRQLFLTGPPAFTAHVTLQALTRGVDVNMNGVFECVAVQRSVCGDCNGDGSPTTAAVSNKVEDTPQAGNRSIDACRVGSNMDGLLSKPGALMCREEVNQVLMKDEGDIFAIAGMPFIDPLLRGAYCQTHKLE